MRCPWLVFPLFSLAACAGEDPVSPAPDAGVAPADAGSTSSPDATVAPDAEPVGLPVLGAGGHSMDRVELTVIGEGGLNVPRDLGFNPDRPGELWVVNRADDSVVMYFGVGSSNMTAEKRIDPYALHFMEEVSSIAFGAPVRFGTCQESRNSYNGLANPNDFMGPSLWSSDLSVFGYSNPDAVQGLGFDLGSHLDMLHESPLCMGIAWEADNIYWTFDGMTGSISRYDFRMDHGVGWDDHSDGIIRRYVTGSVSRVPDVPSHLELDRTSRRLYIADTGNRRIAVLDIDSGTPGVSLPVRETGTSLWTVDDATLTTLVDGDSGELVRPSGLALRDGVLYVTDNASARITAFDAQTGERIDWLDTGFGDGALMGIELDDQGLIHLVDAVSDRVVRLAPR